MELGLRRHEPPVILYVGLMRRRSAAFVDKTNDGMKEPSRFRLEELTEHPIRSVSWRQHCGTFPVQV